MCHCTSLTDRLTWHWTYSVSARLPGKILERKTSKNCKKTWEFKKLPSQFKKLPSQKSPWPREICRINFTKCNNVKLIPSATLRLKGNSWMAASGRRSCMDQPQFWPAKIRLGARDKFISRDSLTWAPNHMSMAQALLPAGDCTAELNFYPWEKKKTWSGLIKKLGKNLEKTWKKLEKNLPNWENASKKNCKKTAKKMQKPFKKTSKKLQKNFKKL